MEIISFTINDFSQTSRTVSNQLLLKLALTMSLTENEAKEKYFYEDFNKFKNSSSRNKNSYKYYKY